MQPRYLETRVTRPFSKRKTTHKPGFVCGQKPGFDCFNFGCQLSVYTAQKSTQKQKAVKMWQKILKQLRYSNTTNNPMIVFLR